MRCTVCHATDLLRQQRLTREGWQREVAKMVGWGAAVDATQTNELVAYLAEQYGPVGLHRPAIGSGTSAAADLVRARCTVCHATDLIEAQRLDAEGWRRELSKMQGWGAVLAPEERDLLVAHLTRHRE